MATTGMDDYFAARDAYLRQFKITTSYRDLWREGEVSPFARMVIKFVDDIVKAEENIAQRGRQIIDRISRVSETVSLRFHINHLGELQRLPAEYDQACVARQAAIENLALAAAQYREARDEASA